MTDNCWFSLPVVMSACWQGWGFPMQWRMTLSYLMEQFSLCFALSHVFILFCEWDNFVQHFGTSYRRLCRSHSHDRWHRSQATICPITEIHMQKSKKRPSPRNSIAGAVSSLNDKANCRNAGWCTLWDGGVRGRADVPSALNKHI